MQRYGLVIKLKKEKLREYKKLHANPWQDILAMIKQCNIRNITEAVIFLVTLNIRGMISKRI